MCLKIVTEKIDKPSKKVIKAWKLFTLTSEGKLKFRYYCFKTTPERGKWMKADEEKICSDTSFGREDQVYTTGFHCYTNKEQAETYHKDDLTKSWCVLLEVKVKEVTTYGKQWPREIDTLVARQLYIPKQAVKKQVKK